MRILFILFFCMVSLGAFAQSYQAPGSDSGYVNIHADPRLDILVKKKPAKDTTVKKTLQRGTYKGKGYRVQIYSGSDRTKANETKMSFMKAFPGVRVYLAYAAPNFRVRVGDFRSRNDAESMLNRVSNRFRAAMIVPDMVTTTTK